MRYGYFDDAAREYVIDRVDVPVSMTNYLGTQRMGTVISHCAGGYSWLDSPQHHRITRFPFPIWNQSVIQYPVLTVAS